jgi:inorganic triphosphatase YgiF
MEVELKLLLDPADNARLAAHPQLAAHAQGKVKRVQMSAHYFDTPDLHLLHHGAGLRVRQADGAWMQTMKAGGSVQSGLHQRNEWEGPVTRAWPQLGKLRKLMADDDAEAWQQVLDAPGLKERLEALFTVQVERSKWNLAIDRSHVELVLDQGVIERHGHQVAVNEIELELKDGEPRALFEFALRLLDDIPLRLSNSSKAERGYELCRQTGTVPVKAEPVELPDDASVAQALLAILGNCLDHVQRNEAAVIAGDNTESLHQMRVGVRRLRSALKLFDAVAPCPPSLMEEIAWLGTQLGAARDWDVLLESTLPRVIGSAAGAEAGNGWMELQSQVLETVRAQRSQAAQALLSQRYTRTLLTLGVWMQQVAMDDTAAAGADDGNPLSQPASSYALHVLQRLHKKMVQRADKASDTDPRTVHRLRIAGKRARYAMEFFKSLYRKGGARRYLDAMSGLQDQLGAHNDLVVADRLLLELQQRHAGSAAALAYVRGYLQAQREREVADVSAIRKQVHALRLPRHA